MHDAVNVGALKLIEATVKTDTEPGAARKWQMGELPCHAKENESTLEDMPITPAQITGLWGSIDPGRINDELTRQVLEGALMGEGSPTEVVEARGLEIASDEGALRVAVQEAIDMGPAVAEKIGGDEVQASGVLVGAVMKVTRGQADTACTRELVTEMVGV